MLHLLQLEIVRWLLLGLVIWTAAGFAVAACLFGANRSLASEDEATYD